MMAPKVDLILRKCLLPALAASFFMTASAQAAVTVIGTQYQQDNPYAEYQCWYRYGNYPTSCGVPIVGCNVNVFIKNTGSSSITVSDVNLAGYSLKTILRQSSTLRDTNSIFYYWQDPPQHIFDVGEPVWYKADPNPIPAGGVGRVVIRLRKVPIIVPVNIGITTSGGNVAAAVPVNDSDPVLANVGFSSDRKKVYLTWRRTGGAAPVAIKMDGNDVTPLATTVGDPDNDFAATVLSFNNAIPEMSYHVYQGIYADGKTATGGLRTWLNRFLYGTWAAQSTNDYDYAAARAWIDTCHDRGVNSLVVTNGSSGLAHYMSLPEGRAYMESKDYGYVKDNSWGSNPRMWFIHDEPDIEEGNINCGTGMVIPCGGGHTTGISAMKYLAVGETLRNVNPMVPTTINLDGNFKPHGWYTYGQVPDVMMLDSYYEQEMAGNHWYKPARDPLYVKPTSIYAAAIATTTAAEPNPMHMILYSCEYKDTSLDSIWPFAAPGSKRIQAYYALAGGAKGMSYWWFKKGWPFNGLDTGTTAAKALWKEIGLVGVEIKTLAPQLVTSHPINLPLTPGPNVWARALMCGTDTLILFVVNDNFYNDTNGVFHNTPTPNATVTAALPSWMQSPSAFEVSAAGITDASVTPSGNQWQINLGTLNLTRLIVLTKNPQLKAAVQQRYDTSIREGVCRFAPEVCANSAPAITVHPVNQSVALGESANFTTVVSGSTPLNYQWQKDGSNISTGGRYSGATSATLTIANTETSDAAGYRCIVSNAYGSATSNPATLTLLPPTPPAIVQHPSHQNINTGDTATLTVVASGAGTLIYQWQKNQNNLSDGGRWAGATAATLVISDTETSDTGSYRCIVSNNYGSTPSNEANLNVTLCQAAVITNGNFEAGTIGNPPVGWTTYIQANASGNWTIQTVTPPEGSQWLQTQVYSINSFGGVRQNITGVTPGSAYTISGAYYTNSGTSTASVRYNLSGNADRANSTVLVSKTDTNWTTFNGTITATGTSFMLFLDHVNGSSSNKASAFDNIKITGCGVALSPPMITQQPAAQNICPGATAIFSVAASSEASLSYQWQKNGGNLANGGHYSGTTTAMLTISTADNNDVANYRCIVSSTGGNAVSNQAALSLKSATSVTLQPIDKTITAGGTVSFTINATGEGTLNYQWQKNGANLANGGHYAGATTAALTITNADSNDAAVYRCVVTAGCGSANSNAAALTVLEPVPGDFDLDGDVDADDLASFAACATGPEIVQADANCVKARLDGDSDVDMNDFAIFQRCWSGANNLGDPNCAN